MPFRFETANERWKWFRLSVGLDEPDPNWNWQEEMNYWAGEEAPTNPNEFGPADESAEEPDPHWEAAYSQLRTLLIGVDKGLQELGLARGATQRRPVDLAIYYVSKSYLSETEEKIDYLSFAHDSLVEIYEGGWSLDELEKRLIPKEFQIVKRFKENLADAITIIEIVLSDLQL